MTRAKRIQRGAARFGVVFAAPLIVAAVVFCWKAAGQYRDEQVQIARVQQSIPSGYALTELLNSEWQATARTAAAFAGSGLAVFACVAGVGWAVSGFFE